MSHEDNLYRLIPEDLEPIFRLARAAIQRLHAADYSGADALLAAHRYRYVARSTPRR